jgi:hypothetical protein
MPQATDTSDIGRTSNIEQSMDQLAAARGGGCGDAYALGTLLSVLDHTCTGKQREEIAKRLQAAADRCKAER